MFIPKKIHGVRSKVRVRWVRKCMVPPLPPLEHDLIKCWFNQLLHSQRRLIGHVSSGHHIPTTCTVLNIWGSWYTTIKCSYIIRRTLSGQR